LLGRYENFPEKVHNVAFFEYNDSLKELLKAILYAFHNLNQVSYDLDVITPYLKQTCEVGFEFGVADGFDFNFLDQRELDWCLKSVDESIVKTLDFFFSVCYHRAREDGKLVPLKFDYHILRFLFHKGGLELRIRHERGTQRVPLDDLINFLVKQVNIEGTRKQLAPLFVGAFRKAIL
jgi:hypothetical protein